MIGACSFKTSSPSVRRGQEPVKWIQVVAWFVGAGGGAWLEIDLLRERRNVYGQTRPQVVPTRSLLRRGAFAGALVPAVVLLIGAWLVLRERLLVNELNQLQPAAAEHRKTDQSMKEVRAEIDRISSENNDVAKSLADVRSSSAFLTELQRVIPAQVRLHSVEVSSDSLMLRGEAVPLIGFKALNAFLIKLDRSTFLESGSVRLVQGLLEENDDTSRLNYEIDGRFAANSASASSSRLVSLGARGIAMRLDVMRQIGVLE